MQLKAVEEWIAATMESQVQARVDAFLQDIASALSGTAPSGMSLVLKGRSSCGSTRVDEEDANNAIYSVDNFTKPKAVKLYIPQQWSNVKVAINQAWPAEEGMLLHCRKIPPVYTRVTIDMILAKKYNKIHIEYPTEEDRLHLDQNKGTIVA